MPLIFYVPVIAIYFIYGQRPHDIPVVGAFFPSPSPTSIITFTPTITNTPFEVTSTPLFVPPAFVLTLTASSFISPTQTPAYQSNGIPSGFPFILDKGTFYTSPQRVLFSYYYPDLGGVNCHQDNWVNGQCANVTASKVVGWREYMGKGIAIHSDMYDEIPYGSQVYVYSPATIAGLYTVVDLCCGCKNAYGYYFDFLFDNMPIGLGWSYNVDFVVTRYGWDVNLLNIPAPNCGQYFPDINITPTQTSVVLEPTQTLLPTFTPFPTETLLPTETPIP